MARKYDREFKLEAIRLATEDGAQATDIERRLGLSQGMISRWKRQLHSEGVDAFPGKGHVSPMRSRSAIYNAKMSDYVGSEIA